MEQQLFIHEILDNPEDDMPRLIYADWLEERGDPLGEFIRVQIEIAQLQGYHRRLTTYYDAVAQPKDPRNATRFKVLWDRQMALFNAHLKDWVKPLIGTSVGGVIFERGCVQGFHTSSTEFLENAHLWYRTMPIRWLVLSFPHHADQQTFAQTFASPWLLKLRMLDARIPYQVPLSNFEELQISSHQRSLFAESLAESPNLANLEELNVGLNDNDLQPLLSSPHLRKLTRLGMYRRDPLGKWVNA